jgi:hypothetical protein
MVFPVSAAFLAAAPCFATGTGTAKPPEFVQATRVEGKVPVSLGGSWFLYAQAQFPGDKSKALPPEILAVSQRGDGDVALRLLDVQMPKSIDEPYKAASKKPKAWEPTPDDIALLRKQWSKLPPAMNKDWRTGDVVYDKVEFTLTSPEKYAEVFRDQQGSMIGEALSGSVFALRVVEKYRPQQTPAGENVAQVMERNTIYVVRSASDSVLEGKQFTGYLAAGPGVPLPIAVSGPFKLYRIANATAAPGSPALKPRGRRSTRK